MRVCVSPDKLRGEVRRLRALGEDVLTRPELLELLLSMGVAAFQAQRQVDGMFRVAKADAVRTPSPPIRPQRTSPVSATAPHVPTCLFFSLLPR